MANLLTKAECLECGAVGGHGIGCDSEQRYQVIRGGAMVQAFAVASDLVDWLHRETYLSGTSVWDNGKRLTKLELTDLWLAHTRSFFR